MSPDRAPDDCPEQGSAARSRGRVALVLALGISGALTMATAAVIVAAYSGRDIDTGLASVLSTALGASVGALATYLGGQLATTGAAGDKGARGAPGDQWATTDKELAHLFKNRTEKDKDDGA